MCGDNFQRNFQVDQNKDDIWYDRTYVATYVSLHRDIITYTLILAHER